MKSKNKSTSLLFILLFLLLGGTFLAWVLADSSNDASCASHRGEGNYPQTCQSYDSANKRSTNPTKKVVLFINAANGVVNWNRVNSLAAGANWEVQELKLDGFGSIMRDESFTAALESSYQQLKQALENVRPDVLLATSKGVGVVAYLASKNLWVDRPVILFSPIPNPIDGLVHVDSDEMGWKDTIHVMKDYKLGPVLVVAGTSSDEELFVTQAMQEPSACGEMTKSTGTFENCRDWRHVVVPGDHGWSTLPENEAVVSTFIDFMFVWLERIAARKSSSLDT